MSVFCSVRCQQGKHASYKAEEEEEEEEKSDEDNNTGNWFILDATQLEITQQITAMMIKAQGKLLAS